MWGGAPHPVKGFFFTPTLTLPRGEGKYSLFWGPAVPKPLQRGFAP